MTSCDRTAAWRRLLKGSSMRRALVMGITAVAVTLALATALAGTTKAPPPTPKPPAAAPAPDAFDDGMERMDGPDAWDLMEMGPAGLHVESTRGTPKPSAGKIHARRAEILKELNLTDAQREKIDAIKDRQKRAAIDQRAKLDVARLDLKALLRADKTDRGAVNSKIDDIARLQAQMRKDQVASMLDVRAVLTPEQQKKLRSMRSQ